MPESLPFWLRAVPFAGRGIPRSRGVLYTRAPPANTYPRTYYAITVCGARFYFEVRMHRFSPYFLAVLLALCVLSAAAYGYLIFHLKQFL